MNKGFLVVLFFLMILIFNIAFSQAEDASKTDEKPVVLSQGSHNELVDFFIRGERENPFLTLAEEQALSESPLVTPISYLNLSAVLYSPGESKVIINGCILKEKDYIDNKEIIEIKQDAVILKDGQGKYIVTLRKVGS